VTLYTMLREPIACRTSYRLLAANIFQRVYVMRQFRLVHCSPIGLMSSYRPMPAVVTVPSLALWNAELSQ